MSRQEMLLKCYSILVVEYNRHVLSCSLYFEGIMLCPVLVKHLQKNIPFAVSEDGAKKAERLSVYPSCV